jgi:2-hydroxycyclohexanecarboxyl-CoA dehydrogenase
MARHHIRINCVSPGPTRTRILEENSEGAEALIAKMIRRIPTREIAEPEDIAAAISFLAGDGSKQITGQVLSVSGGLTMV